MITPRSPRRKSLAAVLGVLAFGLLASTALSAPPSPNGPHPERRPAPPPTGCLVYTDTSVIHLTNPTGSIDRILTPRTARTRIWHPTLNSSSTKIAYSFVRTNPPGSGRGPFADKGLMVMNTDGSGKRRVPLPPWSTFNFWEGYPAISPDGSQIAFHTGVLDGTVGEITRDTSRLYVVNVDGSGLRELAVGVEPEWSPDGSKITFHRWVAGAGKQFFRIDADGTGERRISHTVARGLGVAVNDVVSPDGNYVARFSSAGRTNTIVFRPRRGGVRRRITRRHYVADLDWGTSRLPCYWRLPDPGPRVPIRSRPFRGL